MKSPKRIVICYPLVNGYMAACWRELSVRSGIELFVIGFQSDSRDLVAFSSDVMTGIPSRLLVGAERTDFQLVTSIVVERAPDVLFISGWSEPAYRRLYFDKRLKRVPKVLMMDNQLRRDVRQFVGAIAARPLLSRIDRAFVTGERAWQFARYLGFCESEIHRGVVSVDYRNLAGIYDERAAMSAGWPKAFLYVGRYHERKALDTMLEAYSRYRAARSEPWPLVTAGMGPAGNLLGGVKGVVDRGFVNPKDMRDIWLEAGVFVMPSRFDAWPLSIVEAGAAGLPIIATEACGSTVENVRHLFNGLLVPTDIPTRMADAFVWMHDNHDQLATFGLRSRQFASAYSAEVWTERVVEICNSLQMRLPGLVDA